MCRTTHTLAGEAPQRERLYHDIAAAQARLTAAQQRRSLALKDLNRAKQELERLRGLAKGSKATKQRLADAAAAEADWLARPGAAGTLSMTAGPLSKQVCGGGVAAVRSSCAPPYHTTWHGSQLLTGLCTCHDHACSRVMQPQQPDSC